MKTRRVSAYAIDVALFVVPGCPSVWFALPGAIRKAVVRLSLLKSVNLRDVGLDPASIAAGSIPLKTLLPMLLLTSWMVAWLFYRALTVRRGTSVGKRLCGLYIASHDGSRPTWKQALRRLAPGLVLGVVPIPCTGFLAYGAALIRSDGQGWHDRAAGTKVVRRPASAD